MSQVASDSLLWIKNELDHTLTRARQALETYVERAEDREALGQCLELLHQVQGTLRIVEVYGAAMLAEEMESVVRGFESGELARSDTAFEVLMRAMLQLPDYLERVIGGRRDMPLALLSLLNDLRTVRGQPLLSESALFAYNLASRASAIPVHTPPAKTVDIRGLAAKLRPKFQTSLLGWYKGDDAEKHLSILAETAEKLEQAATTPAVFEMWWIVGGIVEGLREGGIEADVSLKQLLGQVDRQMKKLMEQGEAPTAEDPAKELVNNLLYYIGRAGTSGKRIAAIKESFKLGELLPQADELAEAREGLSGPNINLMRTVSGAIREDIARIKDTLDIFVRMGKSDTAELAPLDELIKKVGDTLTVLGLPALNQELENQRKNLQKMLAAKKAPDEASLMEIASGIVRVESGLDESMEGLVGAEGGKGSSQASEQAEMREVQSAVIRESIINLARVKEAIVQFVNDPSHGEVLKPLPLHLREIQASFRFLQMERVVKLLASLRQYILKRLLSGQGMPSQNELDRMADAIVSVEFYLETVQQGRGNPTSMLDNAEACVAALGFPTNREYPEEEEPGIELTGTGTGIESTPAQGETIVMEEPAADEVVGSEGITLSEEQPTLIVESATPAAKKTAPPPAPKAPAPVPSAAGPAVVAAEGVDPEIVEIFLEEAQEEMNSLRETFPRWRSNPGDREALTTLRRSFHTLKGSGRMVGARLIGEFAWSYENMLNRVIDQTVAPSDDMFALIDMGIAALPELVEQLEVGTAPKVTVQPLMDAAAAMSRGEAAPLPGTAAAQAAPAEEPTMIRPAGVHIAGLEEPTVIMPRVEILPPMISMDPVLYEIFNREAEGHFAVLEAFVIQAATDRSLSEDLVRALHTLHGSAALAGAVNLAQLVEPLHRYVAGLREQAQSMPADHVHLVSETVTAGRAMLAALKDAQTHAPPATLLERLRHLRGDGTATLTPGETVEEAEAENIVMSGPAEEPEAPMPKAKAKPKRPEKPRGEQPPKYVALSDLKDFDPDLAAIFFEEASELLESTDNTMHQWSQKKADSSLVGQLQRNLHTLKGGARMAGLTPMGDLSHEMETVLTDVVDGRIAASTELFILLNRAVDRLHRMMEQAYANQPIFDAGDLVLDLKRVHGHTVDEELEPEHPDEKFDTVTLRPPPPIIEHGAEPSLPVAAPEELPEEAAAEAALGGEAERRAGSRIQYELVRVRADLLEHALNYAGEVGIYRSRLEQQVTTINFNLGELEQTVVRLRDQLRKLEI
ncbi:MAG TPA: Hpt domain-containing protein, partial [Gammaproteobacteria bacterium]|nr:Hpt domain-containing protein [Gammaproteobacteria bacterium]